MKGKQIAHFLHIGKTGGTAVKHALNPYQFTGGFVITLNSHDVRFRHIPRGDKVFFIVRDPLSRFISGFYSRKREGRPRYYVPWTADESAAFRSFTTPNALGKALSSANSNLRSAAVRAMQTLQHVNSSYWDWFENTEYFLSRVDDILFIGFQEQLEEDFETLKRTLRIPLSVRLPHDGTAAHRKPRDLDTHLEEESIHALRGWYDKDYEFLELCGRLRVTQLQCGL